jgi:SAM-dependent methyltransferase
MGVLACLGMWRYRFQTHARAELNKMMLIDSIKSCLDPSTKRYLKRSAFLFNQVVLARIHRALLNPINRARYRVYPQRFLEIGPGQARIPGFETVNVVTGRYTDYVADAARRLPFPDNTFDLIYASHIIEHISWYKVCDALKEWTRALKPGGVLEIWTPDGLKIARAFVDSEERGSLDFHQDGWWRFNDTKDACVWMSGRCFSYGDGTASLNHHNWHRALFSPRYLKELFKRAGLIDVRLLDISEVRGYSHGWINLGMRGVKP